MSELAKTHYELEWDSYSETWEERVGKSVYMHLGDEWSEKEITEARYLKYAKPYLTKNDLVLEIGPGGGKYTEYLLRDCRHLVCVDVSSKMLRRIRKRFTDVTNLSSMKIDGISFNPFPPASVDFAFSFDAFVHLEPEDIYNYLVELKTVLKPGGKACIHTSNMLSKGGWEKFKGGYRLSLGGKRFVGKFSRMTPEIMRKFLEDLHFSIIIMEELGELDLMTIFQREGTGPVSDRG